MKTPDLKLTSIKVEATTRKIKGGFSIRPDGKFLLTPNDDPEAHMKFWEEMEKEPMNEY